MFEQAELRGIPMGPSGPPNEKSTAKFAREITIPGILAFLVIWRFWAKQAILVILASHFRARAHLQQKNHVGGCSDQSDRAMCGFGGVYIHRKPDTVFYWRGFFGGPFPPKRAILVILASHLRTRAGLPKKIPLSVLLKSTRPS